MNVAAGAGGCDVAVGAVGPLSGLSLVGVGLAAKPGVDVGSPAPFEPQPASNSISAHVAVHTPQVLIRRLRALSVSSPPRLLGPKPDRGVATEAPRLEAMPW